MRDDLSLLQAILDDPNDDLPRLIYADWCEENGDADRAEFIRVQIELAKMPKRPACNHRYRPPVSPPFLKPQCPGCRHDKKWKRLRKRELQLLGAGMDPPRCFAWCEQGGLDPRRVWIPGCLVGSPDANRPQPLFTRGFISFVAIPEEDWIHNGSAIARQNPVERVELSDKESFPQRWDRQTANYRNFHTLHPWIFECLAGGVRRDYFDQADYVESADREWREYDSGEDASIDLSHACLLYAKGMKQEERCRAQTSGR